MSTVLGFTIIDGLIKERVLISKFLLSIPSPHPPPSPPPRFFFLIMNVQQIKFEIDTDVGVLLPVTWRIIFLRGCFVTLRRNKN